MIDLTLKIGNGNTKLSINSLISSISSRFICQGFNLLHEKIERGGFMFYSFIQNKMNIWILMNELIIRIIVY